MSVTFKLTVYVHGASNVFVYILFVPFATLFSVCNAVHAQLPHEYISYFNHVDHHVSAPLNVYVITLHSSFAPLLLIFHVGATLFHVAVLHAQLPLH